MSVGEITRRLGEIQDELMALPPGASPERYVLLTERDVLRRRAGGFRTSADETRSSQRLEAELRALRRRRKQSVSQRTGFATGKGGGNHSPTPGAWVKLGVQALAGDDLSRVNARIAEIEDVLSKRPGPRT